MKKFRTIKYGTEGLPTKKKRFSLFKKLLAEMATNTKCTKTSKLSAILTILE